MNMRKEETIIVTIAALLLIGVFGAISYFDNPHSDVGEDYGLEQVDISIVQAGGNIVSADLPEGLLIFGAGASASMDFKVVNSDPDNDIDTIVITIPGATITNSSYSWSELGEDHQWNATIISDSITFTAVTDYPGINHGGSDQYDTAGSEDDALDHDPSDGSSEGITLTVTFTAPTNTGLMAQSNAIDVSVGDLITEEQEPLTSFAPFPYPYWVASNGSNYIIMVLKEMNVDLEVVYDGQTYFGATRSSGFQTFDHGMKFYTTAGNAVAVVEKPTDNKIVKPAVRAKTAGLTGQFTIDAYTLLISDITVDPSKTPIVTGYKDDIPATTTAINDLDIDSDGTYNNADDDADGDGQDKTIDRNDRDRNVLEYAPTGLKANVDKPSVKNGESFVLTASATDANNDVITFTWTVDKFASWSQPGPQITVEAEGDFKAGETYVFTVKADDGHHSTKPTETVLVTIKEEKNDNTIIIFAVVAIIVVVAIVAFFLVFRKKEEEREEMEEIVEQPSERKEKSRDEASAMPKDAVKAAAKTGEYEAEEMLEEDEEKPRSEDSEEIEKLEALAEDLDESDTCPECGSTLGPNEVKCASCGAEFDLTLECPGCQSQLSQSDKKCPGCGMEFA